MRGPGENRESWESCCPALTCPLNFKVTLHWSMLGRGGDLAPCLLLSAVCSAAAAAAATTAPGKRRREEDG